MNNSKNQNKKIVKVIILVIIIMSILTASSVPLYKLYCQVTGLGGTVRVFQKPSEKIGKKKITVHLNNCKYYIYFVLTKSCADFYINIF